ncbi:MAG: DUF1841 family protein [Gammaproteobacteria bacterium]
MFGNDRNELRRLFFSAWRKQQNSEALQPLEALIAEIIRLHPEYHALLEDEQAQLDRDYTPEMGQTNPFLHMAMHISIQEQLQTDRPAGIRSLYQQLIANSGDAHEAEHLMMECLGQMIWQAQRDNSLPDESQYLTCLQDLCRR